MRLTNTNVTRTVFITGGSSGIGLAIAHCMARQDAKICFALFARDRDRLAAAATSLQADAPHCLVQIFPVDLTDFGATTAAIDSAIAALGVPDFLVLSAGMTLPGRWDRIDVASHRAVMEINFFACISLLQYLTPSMTSGSAIGMIGSAAGLVGTYGYAAYSPSKFALFGLAETLRIELQPRGISVTLCLPPDTDTPMLAAERQRRPVVTTRMASSISALPAAKVAEDMVRGMSVGRFLVLPGIAVKLLYFFAPWIAPILRWRQARLIRHHGED